MRIRKISLRKKPLKNSSSHGNSINWNLIYWKKILAYWNRNLCRIFVAQVFFYGEGGSNLKEEPFIIIFKDLFPTFLKETERGWWEWTSFFLKEQTFVFSPNSGKISNKIEFENIGNFLGKILRQMKKKKIIDILFYFFSKARFWKEARNISNASIPILLFSVFYRIVCLHFAEF